MDTQKSDRWDVAEGKGKQGRAEKGRTGQGRAGRAWKLSSAMEWKRRGREGRGGSLRWA